MFQSPFGFSGEFFPYIAPGTNVDQGLADIGAYRYSTPQQVHRLVQGCAALHESDLERVRGLQLFLTRVVERVERVSSGK